MRSKLLLAVLTGLLALVPITVAGAAPKASVERWAVVIGISQYQGRTVPTPGSAGDAALIRETLLRNGWADDHIKLLVNEAATADAIREAMAWLVERSSDNSFSVFAYSGHVKQKPGDEDGDVEDLDEFRWPHNNSFIADAEVDSTLGQLRGDAWINISGCEAAGFDEGGLSNSRRLFTGASLEHEKAYERPDWALSVFNGLMVRDALLGGTGDTDGSGAVSIQEAFDHAALHAPAMTAGQHTGPQHPYRAGGDGSQWFLSPPAPATPEPMRPAANGGGGSDGLLGGVLDGLLG